VHLLHTTAQLHLPPPSDIKTNRHLHAQDGRLRGHMGPDQVRRVLVSLPELLRGTDSKHHREVQPGDKKSAGGKAAPFDLLLSLPHLPSAGDHLHHDE